MARDFLGAVACGPHAITGGDSKPRAPMQRHDHTRRDFRALHETRRVDSGDNYAPHKILIAAVHRSRKSIHSEINWQAPPRRLVHRTESPFRRITKDDGNLRLRVHKVFVTSRGEIGAEAVKIICQKSGAAYLGIHGFAEGW